MARQENKENNEDIRVDTIKLDEVCCDCLDFLKPPQIQCEDCPVEKLKERQK